MPTKRKRLARLNWDTASEPTRAGACAAFLPASLRRVSYRAIDLSFAFALVEQLNKNGWHVTIDMHKDGHRCVSAERFVSEMELFGESSYMASLAEVVCVVFLRCSGVEVLFEGELG